MWWAGCFWFFQPIKWKHEWEGGEKMNKSHRLAMAQALLAELSEATARHGANNDGVRRLHRMVRDMVAQLLA